MPAKGQKMVRHDWIAIRSAFVEGTEINGAFLVNPSLGQVAEKFGCAPGNMRRIAGEEKWIEQRGIYQARIEQGARDKKVLTMAAKGAEFDAKNLEIASALLSLVKVTINQEIQALQADSNYTPTMSKLKDASFVQEKAQRIGRLALGDTTEEVGNRGSAAVTFSIIGGGSLSADEN
jgi:hypothetical protein